MLVEELMKIRQLSLKNIGPFIKAEMCFLNDSDEKQRPVVLITGENGTGFSYAMPKQTTVWLLTKPRNTATSP